MPRQRRGRARSTALIAMGVAIAACSAAINAGHRPPVSAGGEPNIPTEPADLVVEKARDGVEFVPVGDLVSFTVQVFNRGPGEATGVVVVDRLPAGLEFVAVNPSVGSYDHTTGAWSVGRLVEAGSQFPERMTLVARVTCVDFHRNTATVSGQQQDPAPGNNEASSAVIGIDGASCQPSTSTTTTSTTSSTSTTTTSTTSSTTTSSSSSTTMPGAPSPTTTSAAPTTMPSGTGPPAPSSTASPTPTPSPTPTQPTGDAPVVFSFQVAPAQPIAGQPITVTVNVDPANPGAGAPTGTVQLLEGGRSLGTATLSSPATLTTTLAAGTHRLVAVYSGDSVFAPATSDPFTVVVAPSAADALPTTGGHLGAQAVVALLTVAVGLALVVLLPRAVRGGRSS